MARNTGKEGVASAKFWSYIGKEGVGPEELARNIGKEGVASSKFWSYSGKEGVGPEELARNIRTKRARKMCLGLHINIF